MISAGDVELIDVREEYEFDEVHIKGAKIIPMSLLPLKIDEIDWSKRVVLYCRSGARSWMIARQLSNGGHDVYDLANGIQEIITMGDEDLLAYGK
jgi:rhodanese-related sulfurtransferase